MSEISGSRFRLVHVALPPHERSARIGRAAQGTVERAQHFRREPAGEAVARKPETIAHGAHAHRGERLEALRRPARAGERQWREATRKAVPTAQRDLLPGACEPERGERRRRNCELRLDARGLQALAHAGNQPSHSAEQPQAATHLEQHAVGRFERDAWREVPRAGGNRLEQRTLARDVARQHREPRQQRQRRVERHAVHDAGCSRFGIAGADHLAPVLHVHHHAGGTGRMAGGGLRSDRPAQRLEHVVRQVYRKPELASRRDGSRRLTRSTPGRRRRSQARPVARDRGRWQAPGHGPVSSGQRHVSARRLAPLCRASRGGWLPAVRRDSSGCAPRGRRDRR